MMTFRTTVLGILIALLMTACGGSGDQNSTEAADGEQAATAGNSGKIITLHPTITEIVFALEAEDEIAATDESSKYPEAAEKLPKVGYHRMLDAEKLLSYEPSLLLISPETGPATAIEQVKEAGVKTVLIEPTLELNKVPEVILAVGEAIGQGDQAKALSDEVGAKITEVQQMGESAANKPRVLTFYDRGGLDRLFLVGSGTAPHALVAGAGATPALDFEGHKSITSEAVIASDPDYILLPESTLEAVGGVDGLKDHKILGQTKAAKNGKVVALPSPVFFGLGAHTGQTLEKLYKAFHEPAS